MPIYSPFSFSWEIFYFIYKGVLNKMTKPSKCRVHKPFFLFMMLWRPQRFNKWSENVSIIHKTQAVFVKSPFGPGPIRFMGLYIKLFNSCICLHTEWEFLNMDRPYCCTLYQGSTIRPQRLQIVESALSVRNFAK